jgi:hypothetical protein
MYPSLIQCIIIVIDKLLTIVLVYSQANDEDAMRNVINEAYAQGIHNRVETGNILKGFHLGFDLLSPNNNLFVKLPILFMDRKHPQIHRSWTETHSCRNYQSHLIHVAGNAALARVKLFRDGTHIFTDCMALYKIEDGWRVVSKT